MAKVLVVDDSPLLRKVLCDYLRDLGHEPLAAATAVEAVAMSSAMHPDLVIKDLVMKDTDPNVLMKDLRQHRLDLPIIVCTTNGMRHDIQEALRAGADDFLVKPFTLQDVEALLQRHLPSGD